ncbi:CLOCK-interacting pacemaker-like [Megalops cyprinoides]|uniref:CLOCK-interacting pacemaker-like n=1 Tax=Megalops cyprinoides TaxID=118141 RepID=UPI0018648C52|nr:CLOCK-interacting pacemaker-like [Megalops cyprinoides]
MRETQRVRETRRLGRAAMSSRVRGQSHRKLSSDMASRMRSTPLERSKPESERDSGFSDGSSEHLSVLGQTDSDDTSRGTGPSARASGVSMVGGPYSGLSPMIIMNNVLLKQPGEIPPSPKPWGFRPAIEVIPQPQVVFLQPVVSNDSSSLPKTMPVKRRRSKKYLPILKSYPKIAPHPGESGSERASSGSSERSSFTSGHWKRRHSTTSSTPPVLNRTPSSQASSPGPFSPLPDGNAQNAPAGDKQAGFMKGPDSAPPTSSTQPPSPPPGLAPCTPPALRSPILHGDDPLDCHNKRKRFCNTYNILSQSGLLDITLRTKELIRQNRRSQAQLEQLRTQAGLFLEAVQSDDPGAWARLQSAMQEAGPEDDGERAQTGSA